MTFVECCVKAFSDGISGLIKYQARFFIYPPKVDV
jgi:hypothetical protein